jgi:hypothetical protein
MAKGELNDGKIKGPGDFDQPEPEEGGILEDWQSAHAYLSDHLADLLRNDAMDYIAEYMSSWRDEFAQAKLARQFLALAESCTQAAIEQEARDALEGPDHE